MAYINGQEVLFSANLTPLVKVVDEAEVLTELINGTISRLDIPDGVTAIRTHSFYACGSLTSVTFPETLTEIKSYAFYNCYSLAAVEIPAGVKSIGTQAFGVCSKIWKIVFKGKPDSISILAFNLSRMGDTTIVCPWKEGEVAGAPWGATNATIQYTG